MTSKAPSGGGTGSIDTEPDHGRRRFVQLTGSALTVGLAGCSDIGIGTGDEDGASPTDTDGSGTPTDDPAGTEGATETDGTRGAAETEDTEGPTDTEETATDGEETPTDDGEATTDGEETPTDAGDDETPTETEEDVHEHGKLYLEIDGERQPFDDPKYYPESETQDGAAGDHFHFHDDGHENRWHMHEVRLTFDDALDELPDISYESSDGSHVVHFDGETYDDGEDGTAVEIHERDVAIDPEQYELQDGDVLWIEIYTNGYK